MVAPALGLLDCAKREVLVCYFLSFLVFFALGLGNHGRDQGQNSGVVHLLARQRGLFQGIP